MGKFLGVSNTSRDILGDTSSTSGEILVSTVKNSEISVNTKRMKIS